MTHKIWPISLLIISMANLQRGLTGNNFSFSSMRQASVLRPQCSHHLIYLQRRDKRPWHIRGLETHIKASFKTLILSLPLSSLQEGVFVVDLTEEPARTHTLIKVYTLHTYESTAKAQCSFWNIYLRADINTPRNITLMQILYMQTPKMNINQV